MKNTPPTRANVIGLKQMLNLIPRGMINRHTLETGVEIKVRTFSVLSQLSAMLAPAKYTGLDLNPVGIAFCKDSHHIAGLDFIQGDAENLPFAAGSFDVVVNVEASHCYPDFRGSFRKSRAS